MTAGSPWFRATDPPDGEPEPGGAAASVPEPAYEASPETAYGAGYAGGHTAGGYETPSPSYDAAAYTDTTYQGTYPPASAEPLPRQPEYGTGAAAPGYTAGYEPAATAAGYAPRTPERAYEPPAPEAAYGTTAPEAVYEPIPAVQEPYEPHDETMALRSVERPPAPEPGPGRAERRRAAKGRGRRAAPAAAATAPAAPAAPLSRVEARRAARARKESVGVVASRVVGELFITFGVVMLLFVTYQLWWTNVRAGQQTDRAKQQIENDWSQEKKGDVPAAFEPGQGFAIMYIPKLDVVVPIAEGISKPKVLDRGMVGHYAEGTLKTAMPADKEGNFAVAGHRNTHGEPFRYINQLQPGDPIVVETRDAYYTYEMASILPQTSPANVSVIRPVPEGSGFKGPGRYITLTTCTPEFTSTYRMIVWGKMVEERPRSKGRPDALVG
ncbi:class E sortase [Streptomyces sp. ms191]|uniref:class E sortase n=1 Tax=Streptomyces sp. ms191 TaxID=1827978 RepID=UPI0011CD69DA|nr:class E sortase [Streptomyces sp. ms191]TXS30568.1 class E sortase [Streptomyces sp. ms191]